MKLGGLARRATLIKNFSDSADFTLQVDAGGFSKGYGPAAQIQTEYLVRGLLDIGYDAINLSPKDFYKGGSFLKGLEEEYKFSFLAGGIYYTNGKSFSAPSFLKTIEASGAENPPFDKLKIGLIGLCDQQDKLLRGAVDETQVKSIDPVQAAKEIIPELRKKSDLVVLIYHGKYKRLEVIIKENKGIDVVILGGEYYSARSVVGSDAIIVSTPSLGKHLSSLTLTIDSNKKILSHQIRSIALDSSVKEDAKLIKLVQDFEEAKKAQAKNNVHSTSR